MIAEALGGAKVLATRALTLIQYAAARFHNLSIETKLLDICDSDTLLPMADLVVAADIMYRPLH
jgi:hypothetical protein